MFADTDVDRDVAKAFSFLTNVNALLKAIMPYTAKKLKRKLKSNKLRGFIINIITPAKHRALKESYFLPAISAYDTTASIRNARITEGRKEQMYA
jgi:undecaprenyl pyrophosphate phosphatase UppP